MIGDSVTTLILTPTIFERNVLEPILSSVLRQKGNEFELCGFGPIVAAARTMQLLSTHKPSRVYLVGIAGTLRPNFEVGTAHTFHSVACDGVGAGTGANYKSADEIGWKQWDAEEPASIGDVIPLSQTKGGTEQEHRKLLTVCAASANKSDVAERLARHSDAIAEDMEGFGVAIACTLASVPLQIIRGISNQAGDRSKRNWRIDEALQAAGELAKETLTD